MSLSNSFRWYCGRWFLGWQKDHRLFPLSLVVPFVIHDARNCNGFSVISNFIHTFWGIYIVINKIFWIILFGKILKIETYVNSSCKDIHRFPEMTLEFFAILMLWWFWSFVRVLHRKTWWNSELFHVVRSASYSLLVARVIWTPETM